MNEEVVHKESPKSHTAPMWLVLSLTRTGYSAIDEYVNVVYHEFSHLCVFYIICVVPCIVRV